MILRGGGGGISVGDGSLLELKPEREKVPPGAAGSAIVDAGSRTE